MQQLTILGNFFSKGNASGMFGMKNTLQGRNVDGGCGCRFSGNEHRCE